MRYRRLGHSGLKISVVGLGTWLTFGSRIEQAKANDIVDFALDAGVNFIDTADVYDGGKAEEALGSALAGVPRKDFVLATKVFFPTGPGPNDKGLSRKHIDESIHASLTRLRTSYVDLYQCHRYDEETPVYETVRAFDDLISQGKILYWGVSMWTAEQIDEAVAVAREIGAPPPVSNQPVYSLLRRDIEADVMPTCRERGLGILPYSPLAQGVLTGKYADGKRPAGSRASDDKRNQFINAYFTDDQMKKVDRHVALAGECGLKPAQLAIAWILRRPEIASVIVGATRVDQMAQNIAAAEAEVPEGIFDELDRVFAA